MLFKLYASICLVGLLLHLQTVRTQDDSGQEATSMIQIPKIAIEKLANVTGEQNLWILLPSNFSTNQLTDADFSLFKLNTQQLYGADATSDQTSWIGAESDSLTRQTRDVESASIFRHGRKMNLFGNVLNKPKVSPLYLVNGTVCRFVNAQPICTTLSTTGLFRGQLTPQNNNGAFNNLFQQQQGNSNLNQRQVSPPNTQGFNNQQNNFQQFRPAALLEDETHDLNVEASNNSVKGGLPQSKPNRQQVVMQAVRPLNYVTNRRPLNLLSFGRPFRTQYQRRGKDATSDSLLDELQAVN